MALHGLADGDIQYGIVSADRLGHGFRSVGSGLEQNGSREVCDRVIVGTGIRFKKGSPFPLGGCLFFDAVDGYHIETRNSNVHFFLIMAFSVLHAVSGSPYR